MKKKDNQKNQTVAFHRTFNSLLTKELLLLLAYENFQNQEDEAKKEKAKKELDRAIEIANSDKIMEGNIELPCTFSKVKKLIDL